MNGVHSVQVSESRRALKMRKDLRKREGRAEKQTKRPVTFGDDL